MDTGALQTRLLGISACNRLVVTARCSMDRNQTARVRANRAENRSDFAAIVQHTNTHTNAARVHHGHLNATVASISKRLNTCKYATIARARALTSGIRFDAPRAATLAHAPSARAQRHSGGGGNKSYHNNLTSRIARARARRLEEQINYVDECENVNTCAESARTLAHICACICVCVSERYKNRCRYTCADNVCPASEPNPIRAARVSLQANLSHLRRALRTNAVMLAVTRARRPVPPALLRARRARTRANDFNRIARPVFPAFSALPQCSASSVLLDSVAGNRA